MTKEKFERAFDEFFKDCKPLDPIQNEHVQAYYDHLRAREAAKKPVTYPYNVVLWSSY